MIPNLALLSMLAVAPDGTAIFDGSYVDPATGATQPYTVDAETDGSIVDSEGRSGTYELYVDPAGGRVLELSFGRLGIHTLYEGPTDCWEEPQPPVNPSLGELAICLSPYRHRLAHFDTQGCEELDTDPLYLTSSIYPQEAGDWMAGRITSSDPDGFWVSGFSYVLNTDFSGGGYTCAPADHRVQLFVGPSAAAPPASPVLLYEYTVPGTELVDTWTEVTRDLPDAFFLPPDQSLFVSIEMVNDGTEELCTAMCGTTPGSPDLTFWSDATMPPYPWYDLEPFGFYDIMVQAYGVAA